MSLTGTILPQQRHAGEEGIGKEGIGFTSVLADTPSYYWTWKGYRARKQMLKLLICLVYYLHAICILLCHL